MDVYVTSPGAFITHVRCDIFSMNIVITPTTIANYISQTMVSKLELTTLPHPKSCYHGKGDRELYINEQCYVLLN